MQILIVFSLLLLSLRLFNCQDIITTIAGSSSSGSFNGDGGSATSATLFGPGAATLDSSGIRHNIYKTSIS